MSHCAPSICDVCRVRIGAQAEAYATEMRSRAEGVVVRQHCGGVAAGEELLIRGAADRYFLAGFDDGLDAEQRDAAEAAYQNIAEAEALGAHGRTVGESEDVMRRDVECFGVGEMQ